MTFFMFPQTSGKFWEQMRKLNNQTRLTKDSAYAFDGTWIIAVALNAFLDNETKYEILLNPTAADVLPIKGEVQKVNFQGLTVSDIIFLWSYSEFLNTTD